MAKGASDRVKIAGKASWEQALPSERKTQFTAIESPEIKEIKPDQKDFVKKVLGISTMVELNPHGLKMLTSGVKYDKDKQYWLIQGVTIQNVIGHFVLWQNKNEYLLEYKTKTDKKKVFKENHPLILITTMKPDAIYHSLTTEIVSLNGENLEALSQD